MCTERAPADDVSGAGVTMRLYAKDKRNLRVKRRSTGIVSSYRPNSDTSNRQVMIPSLKIALLLRYFYSEQPNKQAFVTV